MSLSRTESTLKEKSLRVDFWPDDGTYAALSSLRVPALPDMFAQPSLNTLPCQAPDLSYLVVEISMVQAIDFYYKLIELELFCSKQVLFNMDFRKSMIVNYDVI